MSEPDQHRQQLRAAIAAQEALRSSVGDAVVDAAVAALRAQLNRLDEPAASTSERRSLTVLFADLSGFTSLSERLDAEVVREFLNEFMDEVCAAVGDEDGTVEKFLGDAGVALFEGSEDAERAVRSALSLRERLAEMSLSWEARLGQSVDLHIGIDTGAAVPGTAGLAARSDADGTIAAAARLKDTAGAGQILVGPTTHQRTVARFDYELAAPIRVDGCPRRVYSVREDRAPGRSRTTPPAPVRRAEARPRSEGQGRLAEDELRQVTVLFADLAPGEEDLPDSEAGRQLYREMIQALSEVVTESEGVVERSFDHALMAVFGAPMAHEDDPLRAVRTALAMQEQAAARAAAEQGESRLQIGINTGAVVAGEIEMGTGSAYALTGDVMNTAARFRAAARPGEILVGADTFRLTEQSCDYEPLAPLRLKGKARPVPTYALLGLRSQQEPVRGLERRGIVSPLVGRGAEMECLSGAIEALRHRRGGIVHVVGEAGMGKSRLVAEARRASADVYWLEGRAVCYGSDISYGPFVQILRRACEIPEDVPAPEAWRRLARCLEDILGEDADRRLPYLATLLGVDVPESYAERVRYLDADAVRRQIFLAVRRFFERLARERPVILAFEDLHWGDQSTADLLNHLRPLVREVPLLLLLVSRPELAASPVRVRADVEYADVSTEIRLFALSPPDTAHLLQNLLQIDDLPPRVRELILHKAEGNPFFVEEVIRTLIDVGTVTRDRRTGRWKATGRVEDVAIPDTIHGVVMARVDRLDEDVKQILRLAAVVGRSFFYCVLRELAGSDPSLERGIVKLQEIELIREKSRLPELQYVFQHALVQDAVYDSILRTRRKELHGRTLEAIERLYADRLGDHYGLLAFHAARAEEWEKAQEYLIRSGDRSGKIAADSEALAQYQQALSAYARAFGDHWDPFRRAVLERKIGEAYYRRGELRQAAEHLHRALRFLGSPYPQTILTLRAALLREFLRQIGHQRWPGLFLRRVPAEPDPRAAERADIYHLLAWISYNASHDRLVYDCLCQLNVSERGSVPAGIVRGSMGMGLVYDSLPAPRLAEQYHRRAVGLARRGRDPLPLAQAQLGLGMHEFDRGNWDSALETMEEARTLYRDAGDVRGWGAATNWMFWIHTHRGCFNQAIELARSMSRVGEDSGDTQLWAWGAQYWGSALARCGRLEEAIPLLTRGRDLYRSIGEVVGVAQSGADLALCAYRQGDLERALEIIDAATQGLIQRGIRLGGAVPPRAALAELLVAEAARSGKVPGGPALDRARKACRASLQLGRVHRESLIFGCRSRGTLDWLSGRRAAASRWWHRSLSVAEELGARYEIARTCAEAGRWQLDVVLLRRGVELFAELDSRVEWRQAQELLDAFS